MIKIVRLEREREIQRVCIHVVLLCMHTCVCVHDCAYMCLLLYVSLPWSDSVTDVYVCVCVVNVQCPTSASEEGGPEPETDFRTAVTGTNQ